VSDFFYELTPDRVLNAVEQAGFHPTGHCSPLTCLENRVYDIRLEDSSHVVAKFYRPNRWSREAILEEHRFLADLREAEIPVCAPISFPDGGTLRSVEGIHYALWDRVGGRAPDEFDDEQVLEPLAFLEERGFLPRECRRRYRAAVAEVTELYTGWSEGVPVHRIHGDCHVGNLLRGPDGWCFLDFDDFVVGPAVHDVWMLLPGRDAEGARQRALLIEAYAQFRAFDSRWLRLVEPLRAFRFIFYAAWIAKRWEDKAFPAAFPHFGSADYWENETRDLEELVLRLLRGDETVPGGSQDDCAPPQERELTNEDFFWDL
jgi:Ser/Thr protein kinase RdoA (MazF antagonist)